MISKTNQCTLQRAITRCIVQDNYKVAFFCSKYDTVQELLGHVKIMNNPDMHVRFHTGQVFFSNGSELTISAPQRIQGIELHEIFFDELDSIDYELKQHLRTRVRLQLCT